MVTAEALREQSAAKRAQDRPATAGAALRRHIQEAIARGAGKRELQDRLLKAGWPAEVVKDYVGEAEEVHAPLAGPALVKFKGVTKRFGENAVLDQVSLEIPPGELVGVIGLSGVGKTTLLNVMVGFIEPEAGDVVLQLPDGTEASVFKRRDIVKTMFGFAAQTPSFYGKLTVRENVEHFAALYRLSPLQRISRCNELLKLVGLDKAQHTLAQNLSGGMQKRLDIACALVHQPSILILDEPTADLDPIIRDQIWDLLLDINKRGTTVVVASHVVSELEEHCSKIAILRNQRITEVGTPAQLRDIYSTQYEIFLKTASKNYARLKAFCAKKSALYSKVSERDGQLVLQTPQPQEALQMLLLAVKQSKDRVVHVHVDRPSISEVFESLVRNASHPIH
jgi:ABC-2 type transport system ATP-binding protein